MKLLLDTHAFVWLVEAPDQLSARVRDAIADPGTDVFVSAASAWEIATKVSLGKMAFDATFLDDFDRRVQALGFDPLPVTSVHAVTGARLAGNHRDPFDRMLAGQALTEGLVLATRDAKLPSLGVPVFW
jgi:PIN domain nuclease of toxin-antitoxin system